MRAIIALIITISIILGTLGVMHIQGEKDYDYCHSNDWPVLLTDREIKCLQLYAD